jgi:D-alanine-D-alanine ligase
MSSTAAAATSRPTRVALVFGGRSGEHSISAIAAGGILEALDPDRFEVLPIGITPTGRWTLADGAPGTWRIAADGTFPVVPEDGPEVLLPPCAGSHEFRAVRGGHLESLGDVDVVFPVLHGPYGEDGTIQGALELLDLPYVGSGVLASALSMDKIAAKRRFEAAGLPVAPYRVVDARTWRPTSDAIAAATEGLGWPVFVKPSRAGSSLGISKVTAPDDLAAAIDEAGACDPRVLVEAAVVGRELECAVLGGRAGAPPRTAGPGEVTVVAGHDFYDFTAKYADERAVALAALADIPAAVRDRVRSMAAAAFDAVGAEGLARVDFFYVPDAPQGADLVVNEINTMPGFTPFSLYARMWEAAGLAYPDLVAELIALALARPTGLR